MEPQGQTKDSPDVSETLPAPVTDELCAHLLEQGRLKVSSKLLDLAKIVETEKP